MAASMRYYLKTKVKKGAVKPKISGEQVQNYVVKQQ